MRPIALKTLTWATVAAAVASAVWLAAVDADPGTTLRLTGLPTALLPLAATRGPVLAAAARQRDEGKPSGRSRLRR